MKIIDKIEIKHFRSFLGTPQIYEAQILDLKDLNIFSGANDSGKSNILRALNLFFNNEISYVIPFEFDRDFFLGKKDAEQKVVEIAISFDLTSDKKRDKFLPEKFKISKFYDRNGYRNCTYSFSLKEKKKEIKIDSRADKNKDIEKIFIEENSSQIEIDNAKKREWNYRVKFSGFLNKSVSYEYVPAIRDKNFFAHIFGRVITQIKNGEDKKLENFQKEKNKIEDWNVTIKNKSEKRDFVENLKNKNWREDRLKEISEKEINESKLKTAITKLEEEINIYSKNLLSSISFLDSEFKIGNNLQDFFEGFDVGTGTEKLISLKLRGDGIQAKFVPKILNFLSELDLGQKYHIWGFEEPENSSEYKNQQQLAKEFKEKYSQSKQIFISTHSEEFLQLYDGNDIRKDQRISNLYYVKKSSNKNYGEFSKIYLFDVDKKEFEFSTPRSRLDVDLGQSYLRAKYAKDIKNKEEYFIREIKIRDEGLKELSNIVKQITKPIVFIEDFYKQIYQIAWLKLKNIPCDARNFESLFKSNCNFEFLSKGGATGILGLLNSSPIDEWNDKKIIGVFDFDDIGFGCFKESKNKAACLKKTNDWEDIQGKENECLYRKRKYHNCFYALLLPVPKHRNHYAKLKNKINSLTVELLFTDEALKKANCYGGEKNLGCGAKITKIKGQKKAIWKKLIKLDYEDFESFKPLFDKIESIFYSSDSTI